MELVELTLLVDQFYQKREARLRADKVASALKKEEDALKERITTELVRSEGTKVGGKLGTVTLQKKIKPVPVDWLRIHSWIYDNRGFEILQKRLHEGAVKEHWEDNDLIPGIDQFTVFDLSVSKPGG